MSDIEVVPWLIAMVVFFVVPLWRIAQRMGFKPAFAFIALIPGGIVVLLWVIAFSKWPALHQTNRREASMVPDAGGSENTIPKETSPSEASTAPDAGGVENTPLKETSTREADRIEGGKTV